MEMVMKLAEMKRIAEARTKGEWINEGYAIFNDEVKQCLLHANFKKDIPFIAMAANNFDKLLAVVEAAKRITKRSLEIGNAVETELCEALEELEK
jgi:hypothetical protein